MKQLILLLFPLFMFSQEHIQLELHQDFNLAFIGDDHGNEPFTPDVKISVALQGKQFKYYYFEIKPQFEFADLKGGKFVAWYVNGGWVFNQLIIDRFEAGAYLTIGLLHRFETSFLNYGATFELSYKLTNKLKLGLMLQTITRPDINENIKPNGYVGIKYVL